MSDYIILTKKLEKTKVAINKKEIIYVENDGGDTLVQLKNDNHFYVSDSVEKITKELEKL